jgi:hypothetical protein
VGEGETAQNLTKLAVRNSGSTSGIHYLPSTVSSLRVAGFNSDGLLERYSVYGRLLTGGLDTLLYAYGCDALGKKSFGATGKRDATGEPYTLDNPTNRMIGERPNIKLKKRRNSSKVLSF